MYGFTNDKSKWNLGNYLYFLAEPDDFRVGAAFNNQVINENFPGKYVNGAHKSQLSVAIEKVLNEIDNPALIWDVAHYESGTGITAPEELTELEQESAMFIENVFFSNDYIYVVSSRPIKTPLAIRLKGA